MAPFLWYEVWTCDWLLDKDLVHETCVFSNTLGLYSSSIHHMMGFPLIILVSENRMNMKINFYRNFYGMNSEKYKWVGKLLSQNMCAIS